MRISFENCIVLYIFLGHKYWHIFVTKIQWERID